MVQPVDCFTYGNRLQTRRNYNFTNFTYSSFSWSLRLLMFFNRHFLKGFPYLLDVNFRFYCSLIVVCFLDKLPLLMHFWRINDGDFCFMLFTCCSLLWPVDVYLLSVCVEDVLFDLSWMVLLLSFSLLFCLCFLMSHLTMRRLLALSLFREMFSVWLYQRYLQVQTILKIGNQGTYKTHYIWACNIQTSH